jgi:hypothetical protein
MYIRQNKQKTVFSFTLPTLIYMPTLEFYCHFWTSTVKKQIIFQYNLGIKKSFAYLPTYLLFTLPYCHQILDS